MSFKKRDPVQIAAYDKILRENLDLSLPLIIQEVLHLKISKSEEIPDDVQHTKERKPDALKRVTDSEGKSYILHIEFQVSDQAEMVYRMAEYCIMLARKYKIPVRQYVIYLGSTKPKMTTTIDLPYLKYRYKLIVLAEVDYRLFLKSKHPEVLALAILAAVEENKNVEALKDIIQGVSDLGGGNDFLKDRVYAQIGIFVQLRRNLKNSYFKAMESISTFFKLENDPFFEKGFEKGIKKGMEKRKEDKRTFVKNLLTNFSFSDQDAAKAAEVSLGFVKKVKASLEV